MKIEQLIKEIYERASLDKCAQFDSLIEWIVSRRSNRTEYFKNYYQNLKKSVNYSKRVADKKLRKITKEI